jgi:hypothetical protein
MLGLLIILPLLARSSPLVTDCAPVPASECGAELCLLDPTEGYPRPTAWIRVPGSKATRLRVHLHGWTQHPKGDAIHPEYDFSWPTGHSPDARKVLKMILAYGMDRDSCDPSFGTLVMPLSRGHVDDYRHHFKTPGDLSRWKESVRKTILADRLPWTLSAHSGGGAIAARSIDPEDSTLDRVILLDATYDSDTPLFFNSWIALGNDPLKPRKLEVYSVTGPTAKYSRRVSLPGTAEVDGFTRTVRTPTAKLVLEIRTDLQFDHYSVVPARWDIERSTH